MQTVILDAASLGADVSIAALAQASHRFIRHDFTQPHEIVGRLQGANIVIVNKTLIDAGVMAACPDLKLIAVTATGTNNIDLQAAQSRGIRVCNVIRYGRPSLVQHTFMLMLALAGNLNRYQADARNGTWQQATNFCLMDHRIMELAGKTLGIVGYGDLGQGVAALARALDMRVLLAQRPGDNTPESDRLPLHELLPRVDVLSLHCLLSASTRNLIGAAELALMKPGALLLNTARGGLVDEAALLAALQSGHLGGAGLDVLSEEPPVHGNLLLQQDLPNLIVTPHCAWASREARQRLIDMTADNVRQFIAGTQTRFVV